MLNKASPTCPFCAIACAHPPLPPSSALQTIPQQQDNSYPGNSSSPRSHAFLVLSTKYVLAFLDIMPLSKGHILVTTREHYEKVGELGVRIGEEVCFLSPFFYFRLHRLTERFMRVVGEMAPDHFASSYACHFWPEQCGGRTSLESCTK